MKRSISLILSLLLVFSAFSGLSFGAGAAETDSPLLRESSVDLAPVGGDLDLAGTGHYDIAVGKKVVTENNYRDVLEDGGSVKYDPDTKTLTLNNPRITEAYWETYGAIHINADGVTVQGTFHMTGAVSQYGFYAVNSVVLNGNFTFYGTESGISATACEIVGGTIKGVGTGADSEGLYCDDLFIYSTITKLEMTGGLGAFVGDKITFNNTRVTSPTDAFFNANARTILKPDMTGIATTAVIQPFNGTFYDVWVGARRVTSENCGDIYGNGKASYDPDTKTLTLNDPVINTYYVSDRSVESTYKIYSKTDLTLRGSYHMNSSEKVIIPSNYHGNGASDLLELYSGVFSDGKLSLAGNFTFIATDFPVASKGDLTVESGNLTVLGGEYCGLFSIEGNLIITNDITKVDVNADVIAVCAASGITLGKYVRITNIEDPILARDQNGRYLYADHGNNNSIVTHIVIEYSASYSEYNLWLGNKMVTSENCSDILGDGGKAKFDFVTKTLTLDNPSIPGVYTNANNTYKICTTYDLNLKGSYQMPSDDTMIGIFTSGSLTLDGDFSFCGTSFAVYATTDIDIKSGTLTAVSGGTMSVVSLGGPLSIEDGITKVDITAASYAAFAKQIVIGDNVMITEPAQIAMAHDTSLDMYYIYDTDAKAGAKHVVFEAEAVSPTEAPSEAPSEAPTEEPTEAPAQLDLEGEGTGEAPYLIHDTDEWNAVADYIAHGGSTGGKHFMLVNSIKITASWGDNTYPFSGVFNGNFKTIEIELSASDSSRGVAPFGNINGATIKDLTATGVVSGGIHCSGLVGLVTGSGGNLIENVAVRAVINSSSSHCGGFLGHGGDSSNTVIRNCVFGGEITGAETAGTFWGWSDYGSSVVLENCLDISNSTHPIGRGECDSASLTNVYYTKADKNTGGHRPWSDRGQLAYTVTCEGFEFRGVTGLKYDGTIYAAQYETLELVAPSSGVLYTADAGVLEQNGSRIVLTMPASNVTVTNSGDTYYKKYNSAFANQGFNNQTAEKLFDGDVNTKWCGFANTGTPVLNFRTDTMVVPKGYLLTTGGDTSEYYGRNPVSWTLEGSADGVSWVVLTEVTDNCTLEAVDNTAYAFSLTSTGTDAYYMFRFTVNGLADGNIFQLGELQLVVTDTGVKPGYEEYDIWLGSVRVNSENCVDILNDGGKARFDPATNTLVLNEPEIGDDFSYDEYTCKIFADMDLTVKGQYHIENSDLKACVRCTGDLTVDGDFRFVGSENGIYSLGKVTFKSGDVTAVGSNHGVYSVTGITIEDGAKKVTAQGGDHNFFSESIVISDSLMITSPENGIVAKAPGYDKWFTVCEADGSTVPETAVIEKVIEYNLWVGDVRVTNRNKNDIMNDGGKVKFDPETGTLTLDDPEIIGKYKFSKIYTEIDLTLKGSYHMPVDVYETNCAVRVNAEKDLTLTLDGDFTLVGEKYAITGAAPTVIESGTVTFVSRDNEALDSRGALYIYSGAEKVEAVSVNKKAIYTAWFYMDDAMVITTPEGGYRIDHVVYHSDGTTQAKHIIIERGCKMTFNMNGHGESVHAKAVMEGGTIEKPADPVEEGYDFLGWYADEDFTQEYDFTVPMTGDVDVYAKWQIIEYPVSFVTNGHGEAPETRNYEYGSVVIEPETPADPGYAFLGWFTDEACTKAYDFSAGVKAELILYAKWEQEQYSVVVVADNGTEAKYTEDKKFVYGEEYTLPECIFAIPEGKVFDQWDKGAVGETISITSDTTVTAVWRKIYIVGDVDGNDMVNNRDSVILDRYIANWVGYDTRITNMKAADLNRDGVVNNRDAIILDRYVAVWDGYDKYIIKV